MARKHEEEEVEDREEVEEQQEDGDHHVHVHNVGADKTMNTDIDVNNSVKIHDEVCEKVGVGGGGSGSGSKAPRLPRWTRQEILVLIQGKKVAESRVRRGRTGMMGGSLSSVEPKWATVSAYCKRHGVNRGAVQCRKRWSNLAGDYKKIKEWEANVKDEGESFWVMRNDVRRERKLPGFFDREVFDILNGGAVVPNTTVVEEDGSNNVVGKPRMILFDSGRTGGAGSQSGVEALFSEFEVGNNDESLSRSQEEEGEGEHRQDDEQRIAVAIPIAMSAPTLISAKQYQHMPEDATAPGSHEKQPASKPEIGSTPQGRKRRRPEVEDDGDGVSLEEHLIKVLEKNGRILSDQLEVQNSNLRLDREERKENASSLVAVLNKLADAVAKIADKL